MAHLTASDVGALLASLRIEPSRHIAETFLEPLRDIDQTLQLFEPWFNDDCRILIIGPDTIRLNERIFRASAYHKEQPRKSQLEVCIFAIPQNFERTLGRIQRLRDCYHANLLFSLQERAEAWDTGKELLENDLIRQITRPRHSPRKFFGERLDVIVFDLFGTTTEYSPCRSHLIGLEFMGMSFGIEWNIKDSMSNDNCWKARHGIPYIEAKGASAGHLKVAPENLQRPRESGSLIFHSERPDWDPQSTVSIPVTHAHTSSIRGD
ncbi:hypothetical protein N7540_013151 [Penicillium herquei]|nr:hypothetical protein N7540_013151 [Penicillium herquei]